MMNEIVAKIRELLAPILEREGIHLVDLKLRGYINNQVLSIFLDTESGISLQQIAHMTQEIEGMLDLEDPIPGRYRLEVSSPGIDRPLTEIWQFQKNIGRQLQVNYHEQDQKLEKTGILKAVQEDKILLTDKKQEYTIPLTWIDKAVIKINL
jgi:ribosome maturation factor RimP